MKGSIRSIRKTSTVVYLAMGSKEWSENSTELRQLAKLQIWKSS